MIKEEVFSVFQLIKYYKVSPLRAIKTDSNQMNLSLTLTELLAAYRYATCYWCFKGNLQLLECNAFDLLKF